MVYYYSSKYSWLIVYLGIYMKKFLDPVSSARTWGTLGILGGVLQLFQYIFRYTSFVIKGTGQLSILMVTSIIIAVVSIVIGIGLRKTKIWGLYSFIIFTIISIPYSIYIMFQRGNAILNYMIIFGIALNIILSVWFYSGKKRFVK